MLAPLRGPMTSDPIFNVSIYQEFRFGTPGNTEKLVFFMVIQYMNTITMLRYIYTSR